MLATGRYADAVQADHGAAVALGARGVPFTVLAANVAADREGPLPGGEAAASDM